MWSFHCLNSDSFWNDWDALTLKNILNDHCVTVGWRIQYNMILHTFLQFPRHNINQCESTNDSPYLALTCDLWGVFCEDFQDNWPRCKGTAVIKWWPTRLSLIKMIVCCSASNHIPNQRWLNIDWTPETRFWNFWVKVYSQSSKMHLKMLLTNGAPFVLTSVFFKLPEQKDHFGKDFFQSIVMDKSFWISNKISSNMLILGSNLQQFNISSGNGLLSNRRQASTWTNNDPVYRCTYSSPGLQRFKKYWGSTYGVEWRDLRVHLGNNVTHSLQTIGLLLWNVQHEMITYQPIWVFTRTSRWQFVQSSSIRLKFDFGAMHRLLQTD